MTKKKVPAPTKVERKRYSAEFKQQALLRVVKDGHEEAPRYKRTATDTIIGDAHTDNVFHDDNGDLYPFDVVVEAMPDALESVEGYSVQESLGNAMGNIRGVKLPAGYMLADFLYALVRIVASLVSHGSGARLRS